MHERIAEFAWHRLASTHDDDDLSQRLDRIATTGFDTVLCSDADAAPGALPSPGATGTERLARACSARGLSLWLVVAPDRDGAPLFNADAAPPVDPWMVDGDVALDPRRPPRSVRQGEVADADALAPAWRTALGDAVRNGVAGFVCRDADRLPPAFWSSLTAGVKAGADPVRWVAWTAGLPAERVDLLISAGFDTLCSSAAWWDGRARWMVDETLRHARVPMLAFPADPFAPSEAVGRLSRAGALRLAAVVGDGLLVPQSWWEGPSNRTDDVLSSTLQWVASRGPIRSASGIGLRIVSGPDAPVVALVRTATYDLRGADRATILFCNPDPIRTACLPASQVTTALSGYGRFVEVLLPGGRATSNRDVLDPCASVEVAPRETRVFVAVRLPVVVLPLASGRRSTETALLRPRLAIEDVTPSVDDGRFPVKRTAGDAVRVEADIIIDGHEKLGASVLYRAAGERDWRQVRMEPIGNDRFAASFALQRVGRHEFTIEAWRDVFATYRNELDKKSVAGLDVTLELTEGALLVEEALAHAKTLRQPELVRRLTALSKSLASRTASDPSADRAPMASHVASLLASQTLADMQDADVRAFAMRPDHAYPIDAERSGASFASWYELFPRSLGNRPGSEAVHHGTFDDVIERLPAVRDMGFDVLYFPPIHPIGRRNRKGRNNSLTAIDDDPGSPYAIGSDDGGHDALHPQLGTFEDFKRLRDAALDHGLELALDFAIQCSPDHPWLQQHPGWFAWRPDGSLRYAENPPKKYEDIVNVDFYAADQKRDQRRGRRGDDAQALWAALRDVILLWVEQGVRIFRVDNPHTKPLPFWEWMIGEVRAKYPDTIFLSEAFTRPKVMYRLAKVGFSQSYTYFTWRHTKQEFIDYLTELSAPTRPSAPRDFFRPHFFVNTPDINPVFLQRSGRAGFLIRAALAATLSGLWGVYSGFELCEATPVPGKEDYLDSEKYQLRAWDWQRPGNIIAEITALNRIRHENPALRTHLNVVFENAFDPNILYFLKATDDRSNVLLIAINLDPYGVHEADFEIPLWRWGLADDAGVDVTDLLDGHRFRWQGKYQRMRLDPATNPYAIWRVALAS